MAEPENEGAVSSHKRRLMRSLERRQEIAAVTAKDIVVVRAGADRFSVATDSRLNSSTGRPVADLKPIFGGRLVKRVFDVLPDGSFLHSNCCHDDSTPLVAETIGDKPSRDALWQHLRLLRLSGTKFYVYRDIEAYRLDMTMRRRPHV